MRLSKEDTRGYFLYAMVNFSEFGDFLYRARRRSLLYNVYVFWRDSAGFRSWDMLCDNLETYR